jgi:catechol 2,3-dioxygenase-like lactoylglutathione lyase family enzyme
MRSISVGSAVILNLPYLLPRVVRHFMPEGLTRFLLLHSLVIRPGLETNDPEAAVRRYVDILSLRGDTLRDQRVMVFGYGGRFDVGVALLKAGAGHVVLCEKYAPPDDLHNAALLGEYENFLFSDHGKPRPRRERMTLLQADIREVQRSAEFPALDLVVSSSVYEHLEDVEGSTRSLAALTRPDGLHIHYVDLRDHFFKYPFEMLSYSEKTWRAWLNPTSNHNRFRLWDYRRVFEKYFEGVEIQVLQRYEDAFLRAQPRIRPEFTSGNLPDDSVALIQILASRPRK